MLITEKLVRGSMSRNAILTEIVYTPHMKASARAMTIPISVPAAAKSSLKAMTPTMPATDSSRPSQNRGLRTSGRSSGKNIREKPATHRMEVLVSRVMKAGPM